MNSKDTLIEILEYYIHRLKSGGCTMAEIDDALRVVEQNMEIEGTISYFADFYGKTKEAVSGVIMRRMIPKPKKNLTLYSFSFFRKIVPESWHKKN